MAYSLQLAQINTNTYGLEQANTAWGFPANTNFSTLLMSYWMCGPTSSSGTAGIFPEFDAASFFTFDVLTNGIKLTNQTLGSSAHFFQGHFALPPPPGMLLHCMMSIDTHAQVVQVYINDQSISVMGATWTGTPPFNFNIANTINIWNWDVAGVISSGFYPALADVWISNTPAFVDLSLAANRRRFIAADLTAVDLGATGTTPFGYQPALYMSVRPGGVATDILTNLGVGGGTWNYATSPPTFQAAGSCTLPPVPPAQLAMDNLLCTKLETVPQSERVFLEWSDDRGHSYGSPVGQLIGQRGDYIHNLQWQRLGYARDRVFRLSWSAPVSTALQGAWIKFDPGQE